jgi:hypothetical protein
MNSVVAGSRSRTSSARRRARIATALPPAEGQAATDWERAQHQRDAAKLKALAGLKHKPMEKPE